MRKSLKNPIIKELVDLKLINLKNCSVISKTTRDKKIKVLQDKKSGIIFLEKFVRDKKYYQLDRKMSQKDIARYTNLLKNDDKRRFNQFKNALKSKRILDFRCEFGGFLKNITNSKKLHGLEINKNCIKFLKKKGINVIDNLENNKLKFDVITMFHVLEHLPNQINILKKLRQNLDNNGKIIIEVPSASDLLISFKNLKSFKKFTFWSEHIILHTRDSLKKFLKAAGFKNIRVINFQRYDLNNHLGWFLNNSPGGHLIFKDVFDEELNATYSDFLVRKNKTDTLIAIACK
jgi:2-polyprenyl-3-methyl-5-hydroxy-6-metoxy-1,4-benzoquinol methylase